MMTTDTARRLPIKTIFSGPAGGVSQACFVGAAAGIARLHHLRHGRHLDRRVPGARSPAADDGRRHGGRVPGQGLADRHAHRRRGRRLDRLARRGRQPRGRPAQRGRLARPRRLRPGRHRAHRHRRQRGARPHRHPRGVSAAASRSTSSARARAVAALAARMERPLGVEALAEGIVTHRGGAHDLRHPRDLDPARPRPARLHPDRLRRRRPDARAGHGGGDRHSARARAAPPGQLLGPRAPRRRHQARRRAHPGGPPARAPARLARRSSPRWRPPPAASSSARASRPSSSSCSARSISATAARPSSSISRSARRQWLGEVSRRRAERIARNRDRFPSPPSRSLRPLEPGGRHRAGQRAAHRVRARAEARRGAPHRRRRDPGGRRGRAAPGLVRRAAPTTARCGTATGCPRAPRWRARPSSRSSARPPSCRPAGAARWTATATCASSGRPAHERRHGGPDHARGPARDVRRRSCARCA